jgi:RND family efflux transporter MFP subunit
MMIENEFETKDQKHKDHKLMNSQRKRIAIIILAIVLCFFAYRIVSSILNQEKEASTEIINVKVTQVVSDVLESSTPIIGRITAKEEAIIIPKFPGEVTNVYVSMGDQVLKGDLLFDLDDSQISSSYTQVNDVYQNAKSNYERLLTLFNEGAISKQQLEGAKLQYETSGQNLIMAKDSLSNAKVTTPISGFVTSVNVAVGGMASQAMPAVTISNIDIVQIKSTVSENLINKIKVDDKVKVNISSIGAQPFTGTITALSPSPASGSLTYPLIVTLDNIDKLIKPGMSAEIVITSERKENATVIPSGSVMIKGGKTVVAVVGSNNKITIKDVSLGIDNGTIVEILQGVKVGENIVTTGQQYLSDNSEINIIK